MRLFTRFPAQGGSTTIIVTALAVMVLAGCQTGYRSDDGGRQVGELSPEREQKLKLESPAFADGERVPAKYTCDGENVSPALSWQPIDGAESYALIVDDPDAPGDTFVHWVVYNIPGNLTRIPENAWAETDLGEGAVQGMNDYGKTSYGGPCPPSGEHRYVFTAYALDTQLDQPPGISKSELLAAMKGRVVGQGRLVGLYSR